MPPPAHRFLSSGSTKRKVSNSRSICSTTNLLLCLIIAFVIVVVLFLPHSMLQPSSQPQKLRTGQRLPPLSSARNGFENATAGLIHPPSPSQFTVNGCSSHDGIKKRRIAYAITITKDGFFADGAAVLAYSIMKVSTQCDLLISFVAFVHPNVTISRPTLRKLGFHVIEVPKPINVSAISTEFPFLLTKIDKNGCCGALELIKLNSYRLTQYEWVVHMDADTFLLNPITELFNTNYSLIYTTDPNMASYKEERCEPVQGGFLVLRPSVDDYKNIINTIMTTGFFEGSGWNRSQIGWFWGGMTVQGILPYYYNAVTTPNRSKKVNRCVYNTMADTETCVKHPIESIKSAHFTVCMKPWHCSAFVNPMCKLLHERWFELRKEAEAFYGIPVTHSPCSGEGTAHYNHMQIDKMAFPGHRYTPDESPDTLLPIGNAGFRPDAPYEEYRFTNSRGDKFVL